VTRVPAVARLPRGRSRGASHHQPGSEHDLARRRPAALQPVDRERDGLIGAGTTLHGLRSSYAAWLKRHGASDDEVAAGLGDKSTRMGAHSLVPT